MTEYLCSSACIWFFIHAVAKISGCRQNGQRFTEALVRKSVNHLFLLALPSMAVILPFAVQNRDKMVRTHE